MPGRGSGGPRGDSPLQKKLDTHFEPCSSCLFPSGRGWALSPRQTSMRRRNRLLFGKSAMRLGTGFRRSIVQDRCLTFFDGGSPPSAPLNYYPRKSAQPAQILWISVIHGVCFSGGPRGDSPLQKKLDTHFEPCSFRKMDHSCSGQTFMAGGDGAPS